jgi:hypothetical protein
MLYWPTGGYEAVYYDDTSFINAPEVQNGLNGHSLYWVMTGVVCANWHPVTLLSFVLTHQFFGTNAGAEHLVNAVIHAANAALLFLVLASMTRAAPLSITLARKGTGAANSARLAGTAQGIVPTGDTIWRCAVVAALFAWHPFRVESVAWIAERKDVLCAFFMLLTLGAYARYADEFKIQNSKFKIEDSGSGKADGGTQEKGVKNKKKGGWSKEDGGGKGWVKPMTSRYYWLALVFFAMAVMSKAMAVTLPCLLLLLDVWPLQRFPISDFRFPILRKLVLEKVPFFALTAVFCAITFLVQRGEKATASLADLGLGLRLENVIVSYLRYLGWTLWPNKLAAFYTFPFDKHFYLALWPDWQIDAAILLLLAITILCLIQLSRRPYLAVGWFWYLGTMVPVIGLVQVGSQGMADRYTYIPLIGPVISLVWLVAETWGSKAINKIMLAILTVVILAASLRQTRHQLQFWKNTTSLFRHTIEVTGENTRAEYILGLGLENEGRNAEAMVHYRNAITSQPRIKEAFCAMARLRGQQGEWPETAQIYATMLEDDPNDFTAHLGLVTALPHLGRDSEAVLHLKEAIQTCPNTAEALNNLAWSLATSPEAELRNGSQAVEFAKRACALTGYGEIIVVGTLAAAYAEAGRFDEAVATAQMACDLAAKKGETPLLQKNQELRERYQKHQTAREE